MRESKKVERLLDSIALMLKDERPELIEAVHEVINDPRDGYPYDFKARAATFKIIVPSPLTHSPKRSK